MRRPSLCSVSWTIILALVAYLLEPIFFLEPELHWKWDSLNISETSFSGASGLPITRDHLDFNSQQSGSPPFLWGTATAGYQTEGFNDNSQWFEWESATDEFGRPRIKNHDKSGLASDHWRLFRHDVSLMKHLGLSSYRFSVEWSKWEPQQGTFNQTVIEHYSDLVDALLEAGIEPICTLHHFTNPLWFQNLGSWEKSANIAVFLRFAHSVYDALGDRVKIWCTINEPEVYSMMGYLFTDQFPPAVSSPALAAEVLKNLMDAHVAVYRMFKGLEGGNATYIGFAKNIFQFEPNRRWNPLDRLAAHLITQVYTESVLRYVETGKFRYYQPLAVNMKAENPQAKGALDYIGLNYYSHYHVRLDPTNWARPVDRCVRPDEAALMTDMDYPIYAEGFYRALKRVGRVGVPVLVTENGVADGQDRGIRELWIRRYLYAMACWLFDHIPHPFVRQWRAMKDGVDVRGFQYWSLMDNFEWNSGFSMKFGLMQINVTAPELENKRKLYKGAKPFVDVVNAYNRDYNQGQTASMKA
ncbi:putative glycoside hydrolase family 1 protein [Paratrimastix pyriformis]|uniref:Glycoside hydrolase family 1 protein n=1 Tax=Paratrimastix pyriformis TaxID=342808 RepID=A0ABQ8UAH9_9EUKA|nr:putative glycoside hydrolase family 1 protein [Paratrimastix pyriformis]